jgi:hypothetical protein
MPYSANTFDHILQEHVMRLKPISILDVGAGAGKNGKLVRQTGYDYQLDCLEPTNNYISEYNLTSIYNTVYPYNISQFIDSLYKFNYDLVIFGDVLEHLFRSQVIDYIDYILYKCKWVIVIWPNNMPQDDYGNNPYEIHRSNFTIHDLTSKFDVQFYLKDFVYYNNNDSNLLESYMNYTLIKGYLTPKNASIYNFSTVS